MGERLKEILKTQINLGLPFKFKLGPLNQVVASPDHRLQTNILGLSGFISQLLHLDWQIQTMALLWHVYDDCLDQISDMGSPKHDVSQGTGHTLSGQGEMKFSLV